MVAPGVDVPDYSRLDQVKPVTRLRDWSRLTREEFAATYAERPVVFEGLASEWPAYRTWSREFIVSAVGADTLVEVRRPLALGGHEQQWAAEIPIGVFAREVQTTPGLYLAEWHAHAYPGLFRDIQPLPDFLNDDWLGAIPHEAFAPLRRTPLYWGAGGSATDCHFDNSNTVTWNACLRGTKRWLLFSGRPFPEPTWERKRAAQRLVRSGLATPANHTTKFSESGFVTLDGIQRYLMGALRDLPEDLEFYWADVTPGDLIYVPWRWFHQVHNVTESIAVSRYYVTRENYGPYLAHLREVSRAAAMLTRALIGSPRMRGLVGSDWARRVCSQGVGKALCSRALRRAQV